MLPPVVALITYWISLQMLKWKYYVNVTVKNTSSEAKLSKSSSDAPETVLFGSVSYLFGVATPTGATRPITASVSLAFLTSAACVPNTLTKTDKAKKRQHLEGWGPDRSLRGYSWSVTGLHLDWTAPLPSCPCCLQELQSSRYWFPVVSHCTYGCTVIHLHTQAQASCCRNRHKLRCHVQQCITSVVSLWKRK